MMHVYESPEGLLRAEDRVAESGFGNGFVLDKKAKECMCSGNAVEDYL